MYQTLFYQPILNLLIFLYNIIPGNDLGVAIIILTIIIKLILFPLSKKSLTSQKALQDLQPKINEIKKKYSNNKEQMSREMMLLYKDNKVNPFSSCLPLFIQLPFLFAVFKVFRDGFENGALELVYPFISRPESIKYISFGFIDLSVRNIPMAILAGAAQYWQTKMMMTKKPEVKSQESKDEDMMAIMNKQMMIMMPLLTVFIGMSFPGGLALYWLVTTVLTGLQQVYVFRKQRVSQGAIEGEVIR
ncbi:MAG: YidC/Oxa1 family membrane protein insertase [Candidatus Gastranaerophilaceae bacterium]|jgi:YidC/Oxa1 family membrane protein insertase